MMMSYNHSSMNNNHLVGVNQEQKRFTGVMPNNTSDNKYMVAGAGMMIPSDQVSSSNVNSPFYGAGTANGQSPLSMLAG